MGTERLCAGEGALGRDAFVATTSEPRAGLRLREAVAAVNHEVRANFWLDTLGPLGPATQAAIIKNVLTTISAKGAVGWGDIQTITALSRQYIRDLGGEEAAVKLFADPCPVHGDEPCESDAGDVEVASSADSPEAGVEGADGSTESEAKAGANPDELAWNDSMPIAGRHSAPELIGVPETQ